MRVQELWRYPVKSLQGERLESVAVTGDGLEGDRRYAIHELETGSALTARRFPELLFASARLRGDGGVDITLPDGSPALDDDALSAWLGRRVSLRAAGAFHDSPRVRVSLVSTTTIGPWDRRRFRSNVLLDGEGEDALVGSRVALGDAVIDVGMHIERCVMTTRAQPGGIEHDPQVLRTVARERDARLAVGALVAQPGRVSVGDALTPGPAAAEIASG
jgi:uncharacterized protein YcbX